MKKHPVLNAAKLASAWVMAGAALLPLSALPAAAQQYKVVGADGKVTSPDCSPCDSARQFLRQRGIPHVEKNVTTTEDAEALMSLTGARDAPVLAIGSQVLRGMSSESWASYLDAAGYPKDSKLPSTYQFPAATPLTERREVAREEASARQPALLDSAKEVRPYTPPGSGSAGFRF